MKFPIPYRRRRNEAPAGLDRGSQPYSNAVGIAKWLVVSCRKESMPLGMQHRKQCPSECYRVPKGTLALHRLNPSHFAVPTARLYGWLPLSDAYGICCATMAGDVGVSPATTWQRKINLCSLSNSRCSSPCNNSSCHCPWQRNALPEQKVPAQRQAICN